MGWIGTLEMNRGLSYARFIFIVLGLGLGLGLGSRNCKQTIFKKSNGEIQTTGSGDPGIRRSKHTGSGDPGIRRSKLPNPEIRGSGDPK